MTKPTKPKMPYIDADWNRTSGSVTVVEKDRVSYLYDHLGRPLVKDRRVGFVKRRKE